MIPIAIPAIAPELNPSLLSSPVPPKPSLQTEASPNVHVMPGVQGQDDRHSFVS